MRIAVDVMGGDHGCGVIVAGAKLALEANAQITELHLVGEQDEIKAALAQHRCRDPRVRITHASQVLMNIAQSCKAGIIEYTATTNAWPANAGDAGCQSNVAAQSQYARQLLVGANGRIQVTFQANTVAAGIVANNFIALIPFTGGARHTDPLQPVGEWRCVTNVTPEFRRYLPAACRNNNVN